MTAVLLWGPHRSPVPPFYRNWGHGISGNKLAALNDRVDGQLWEREADRAEAVEHAMAALFVAWPTWRRQKHTYSTPINLDPVKADLLTAETLARVASEIVAPAPLLCPECLTGKHRNCDGSAWDFLADEVGVCGCSCRVVVNPPIPEGLCGYYGCSLTPHPSIEPHSWER